MVFRKFFLILLVSLTGNLWAGVRLEHLTEQAICDAKVSLEKQAQRDRILKYAVIGAAIGGTGFALFKALPSISQYCKFKDDQVKISKDTKRFSALTAQHQDLVYEKLKQELAAEIKKNSQKKEPFFRSLWQGIPSAIGMVVLPEAVRSVYNRTSYLFDHKNILSLTQQLGIADHFGHLEKSLAQFAPTELMQNINYKNKKELLYDAQQLILALNKMSEVDQKAHAQASQEIIIIDCNALIKKMSFVIAYMRYIEEMDVNQRIIINNFANQLFQATCEFAYQIETNFNTQNDQGLVNAVVLFQAAFNSALTNFMIFAK